MTYLPLLGKRHIINGQDYFREDVPESGHFKQLVGEELDAARKASGELINSGWDEMCLAMMPTTGEPC